MTLLLGPDGRRLPLTNLTPPEHRAYSTDWYMVFVRRRSTREMLPPMPPLKAISIDVAWRFAKREIEHKEWRSPNGEVIPSGDLEVVDIKQRAPRPWPKWEVGLKQRWV